LAAQAMEYTIKLAAILAKSEKESEAVVWRDALCETLVIIHRALSI
jgi:hypothetical protein